MEPQRILTPGESRVARRVLVVDDDEATCQLLSEWIQHLGLRVTTAQSADQALTMMRAHPADIAICDIVMPGHDGVWLIDHLRREFPQTLVIIATGLKDMDPAVTLAPCVTAYLVKPFDYADVATAIGTACDATAPR